MTLDQQAKLMQLVNSLKDIEKDLWKLSGEVWHGTGDNRISEACNIGDIADAIGDAVYAAEYGAGLRGLLK